MEFEQLLRKYFDGAMTEAELERFQSLLENVPEYRTELRQSLEIRSLLHDDALNLKPPTDLAEHVRIAVGSSFEADAIVDQAEQTRRRPIGAPLRISAGMLAAACLLVSVALSPTLPPLASTAVRSGAAGASVVETAPAVASSSRPAIAKAAVRDAMRRAVARQMALQADTEPTGGAAEYMALLAHEGPSRSPRSSAAGSSGSTNIARLALPDMLTSPRASGSGSSILTRDPAELLNRSMGTTTAYKLTYDSTLALRADADIAQVETGAQSRGISPDRTLTIGVTLGAGQVAENASPTALLQNSYYFSFSVTGNDRIGVEMGASAFQQERATTGGSTSGGMAKGGQGMAKGTLGMPTEQSVKSSPTISTPSGTIAPVRTEEQQRLEQQITYGAVFYDRRIKLSKSWDLCGRLAVGAADDALLGNVRAYAAYTFPSKGVTLTMGIGGSTLYSLTSKATANSSGNYGIYYGVETGF